MLLIIGYAYDIFNLGFSPWEIEGVAQPDYTFYSSVFNYAAGTYGGVLGGNYGKYGVRVKFFTSGSMTMTDENGDSIGVFSSNFVALDGFYSFPFRDVKVKVGPSLRYASLSPKVRGIALAIVLYAHRDFIRDWGYFNVYAAVDGVGYEALPVGLKRTPTSFKAYAGGKVRYSHLVGRIQGGYYTVGGPSVSGYGGYGRDRIAGSYFLIGLNYRNFTFSYAYNPLGLFGDRHVVGIAYNR